MHYVQNVCPACTEVEVLSSIGIYISMFIILLFVHFVSKRDTSNVGLPVRIDVCTNTAAHTVFTYMIQSSDTELGLMLPVKGLFQDCSWIYLSIRAG